MVVVALYRAVRVGSVQLQVITLTLNVAADSTNATCCINVNEGDFY